MFFTTEGKLLTRLCNCLGTTKFTGMNNTLRVHLYVYHRTV
jgi:hypothetical protein